MSLTLLRKESDTPNITNDMDIRAFKYAGTGYDGVVANYLNECGYSYSGGTLTIKSGEIIVDGWQVDISAAGEDVTFNSISGACYYTVYLEIDLSISENITAELKSTYSTSEYPTVDDGDDISVVTTGVRNFTLYHCQVDSGTISAVESCFDLIDGTVKNAVNAEFATYASEDTSKGTIEERLTNLGFKSGSVTMASGYSATTKSVTRQGNYCILKLKLSLSTSQISTLATTSGTYRVGNLDSDFYPKSTVTASAFWGYMTIQYSSSFTYLSKADGYIQIDTDGTVSIVSNGSGIAGTNQGVTLSSYPMIIGYEGV